jgi:hypothetical protein
MRAITSGLFTAGSGTRRTMPVSAYGGRGIASGTARRGLTTPGCTRPSVGRWQRLYLRPLPHQQGSPAAGSTAGRVGLVRTGSGYARGSWCTHAVMEQSTEASGANLIVADVNRVISYE